MNSHQPQPQDQQQQQHIHQSHQHHQQHQIHQPHHSQAASLGSSLITQVQNNQAPQIQPFQTQPQKNQILPLLLSPSLTPNSNERTDQADIEHVDRVIDLENEFSDTSPMLSNVELNTGSTLSHQRQQSSDIDAGRRSSCQIDNQLSSSSEDLLNLLLELDHEPAGMIGFDCDHQIDQDEKAGIENIRKQLMSCDVQSERQQASGSMSPIVGQVVYPPQQPSTTQQSQTNIHQPPATVVTQQLITQTAPVISPHQQQLSNSPQTHHQQLPADQSMLFGLYSTNTMGNVPVSSSGQSYTTQQQQHVTRISQASTVSTMSNSPSPSWQHPQPTTYSPQNQHNNSRSQSQRQVQHVHAIRTPKHSVPRPTTTSPQQQLHPNLRDSSSSQPVSPSTTEPSPVVKRNPLLNAQLVNSRGPSLNQGRFMSSPTHVLNQNPILNAKLSQSSLPGGNTDGPVVGSPVGQRFVQQSRQSPNFDYEVTSQQPQNAQQHMVVYGPSEQTQQHHGNIQIFGSLTAPNISSSATGPARGSGPDDGSIQQVKQEIRRKVQPPKQSPTTSLLKQLLSDDN